MPFVTEIPEALQLPESGKTDPSYLVVYWSTADVAEQYDMVLEHDCLDVAAWSDLDVDESARLVDAVCDAMSGNTINAVIDAMTEAIQDVIRDNIPAAGHEEGDN